MERKWSIRAYRDGDEAGIFELRKAVNPEREYDQDKWLRWWHWTFKENPAGSAKIWLAEHEDRIVGQYSLIFMYLKVGNTIIKASQNIDDMTHPAYRYQGMFSTLERKALDEVAKEGVHITIGFPNAAAYPGHMKSGWFDIATTRMLLKPLNWGNALKLKISNKFLLKPGAIGGNILQKVVYRAKQAPIVEGLTITQVFSFDERINELWAKVSSQHQIMVVRNKDYLNWRYIAVPDVNYLVYVAEKAGEIYGYLVLRPMQWGQVKVGVIFDMLAQSEPIAQCLISKATAHCKQEKADLVSCSMIASKTYVNAFRKNGFISSMPFVKGHWFCAYSSAPDISKEFLKEQKNWFVQTGDSDTL